MPLINFVTGEPGPTAADVTEAMRLLGMDRSLVEGLRALPDGGDNERAYALLGELLVLVQGQAAMVHPQYAPVVHDHYHALRAEIFDEPCECGQPACTDGPEPHGTITT